MFADDIMVFFDGSNHSLHGITEVLDTFDSWSGLQANSLKTSLYTAGIGDGDQHSLSAYGFSMGVLPIRYLGLPLMSRKLKVAEYNVLLTRVEDRFNSWCVRALSYAGRLQLIQAVITGMINFWASAFILPKACVSRLESLCARFLWTGRTLPKKGARVSWIEVCYPKPEGGLGIRRLSDWNRALCLKLIWLLLRDYGSLWAKWHVHNHLRGRSFWDIEVTNNISFTWRTLLNLRTLAKRFARVIVGNGRNTSLWLDHWMSLGPLINRFGEHGPSACRLHRETKLSEIVSNNSWSLPRGRSRHLNQLRMILDSETIPLPHMREDAIGWLSNGKIVEAFSAKDTWEAIRQRSTVKPWATTIWFKGAIQSHAFTMWMAQLNRLPTRERISRWTTAIDASCPMCSQYLETRDHMLLSCPYVTPVWIRIFGRITPSQAAFNVWADLLQWMKESTKYAPARLRRVTGQVMVYHTWKRRNDRVHNNRVLSPEVAFKLLDKELRNVLSARRSRRKWHDLPLLWLK